ncbi:large ribosomal subunit protein bL35 [Chloroflexus aurantiacus]|nr:MAG: 50S ribosomal protein L35 [Chloroflexus sp.]
MPKMKMKTHKGAKKRFKVTASGKFLQQRGVRGNKRNRPSRSQRAWGKGQPISPTNRRMLQTALPYGLE